MFSRTPDADELALTRGASPEELRELIERPAACAKELFALRRELARIREKALKHLVAGDEVNATTEALVSQLCSLADDECLSRDVVKAAVALRQVKAPACGAGPGCCRHCALLHAVDEYLEEKGER